MWCGRAEDGKREMGVGGWRRLMNIFLCIGDKSKIKNKVRVPHTHTHTYMRVYS